MTDEEKDGIRQDIQFLEEKGKYYDAGLLAIKISNTTKLNEMVKKCQETDLSGAAILAFKGGDIGTAKELSDKIEESGSFFTPGMIAAKTGDTEKAKDMSRKCEEKGEFSHAGKIASEIGDNDYASLMINKLIESNYYRDAGDIALRIKDDGLINLVIQKNEEKSDFFEAGLLAAKAEKPEKAIELCNKCTDNGDVTGGAIIHDFVDKYYRHLKKG